MLIVHLQRRQSEEGDRKEYSPKRTNRLSRLSCWISIEEVGVCQVITAWRAIRSEHLFSDGSNRTGSQFIEGRFCVQGKDGGMDNGTNRNEIRRDFSRKSRKESHAQHNL